ncbi:MAG: crotonase/enoyl-CoA hydratase family protein [Myxococcota bacterium]|nr:crotonase/enoyl-CoA hydratase family protein [Myxococcota bacterium]
MTDRVLLEIEDGIAHVRMNRPEKKNALDSGMFEGLRTAAQQLAEDRSVRAVVLSGAGDSFCSGLDFTSFGDMASGALDADNEAVQETARDLSPEGANRAQQLGWLWQELPVPVIAAVQGAAYGGGFHIALGADVRFVAPDARIAFVEITWGLVPDLSGTQALRRLVPLDVAKKLIFSGEPISGERAVTLHLGTELSEAPLDAAFELARTIASRSPEAIREAKRLLNSSGLVPLREGLANEFSASARLMGTPNQIEAVVAKLERRPPRFADPA